MSGRSAYVRREKVTAAQKHGQQQHQIVSTTGYIPAGPPTVAYSAARVPRSRGSFSSAERGNGGYVPHPFGFAAEAPSRIEKSTFRNFIDRKSDAFRAKLASPFQDKSSHVRNQAGGYSAHQQSANAFAYSNGSQAPESYVDPPRSASGYPTGSAFDGPQWQDFKPTAHDQAQALPKPQNSVRSYEHSRRKAADFDFGDAMRSVKQYEGSGKPPQGWNRLQKDPELWDHTGDTLVYLGSETEGATRPAPSFRIQSSFLEETESPFFRTILREGQMDFGHEFELPQTPKSAPRDGMMSPDLSLPVHGPGRDSRNNGTSQWATSSQSRLGRYAQSSTRTAQSRPEITPPNSDPDSNNFSYPVSFEIYFPAPSDLSRTETLRYHLTTRNVFALLIHKSLVGTSLGQTLKDLHERMEMYMPEDFDTTSLLIDYVVVKGLDDIRNDPSSAAGLLIWSETVGVNWVEAWREAYVTCVALYSRIRGQPEYRAISAISRALMERANLELSVRIQHAEDRLIAFDFTDMWPTSSLPNGPSRDAFGRFSKFLIYFYNTSFWSWPPPGLVQNGQWLNRNVALRLQKDFGALYDYIVDRDVSWEEGENRSPGGKRMRKRGFETQTFRADTDDLPITDILVGFDRKYRYPHVPHPFPLQPESIPVHPSVRAKKTNKRDKSSDARTIERRVAMAYSEATNLYILGSGYESNELVEAFVQFEKSDKVTETNPIEARKGRWILLYGILQTLATITVDTPGLRWTDDVPYFLGPKLKGTPPWRTQNEEGFDEATHENSHCWRVPREWPGHDTSPKSDLSLDAVPNPSIYRANTRASERTRSRAERLMPNTPNHIQKVNNVIGSKRFQSDYINETLRKSEEEREADEHNWARELDKQRTRAADQTSSKAPSRATNRSREQLSQTDLQDLQALVQADEIGADHRWRLEEMERQQAHMPHPQDLERSPSPPIETGHIVDVQQQQHTSGTHTSELDWKELRKKQARERISKDLLKAGPQRQHQANNPVVNRLQSLGEEIEEIRLGDSAHQNGLNSMGTSNAVSSRHSLSKNMSSEQISQQQHSRSHGVARHMGATGSSESIGNSTSYGLLSRTNGTSYNHTNEDRRDAHQRPTRRDTDEVSRERPRDPREQIRDVSISPPNASFTTVSSMPSGQPQTYYTTASPPQSPGSGPSGTAAATGAGSMPIPIPRPSSSRGQKGKSPTVPPGGWPSPGQQSALGMGGGHHISELMHGNGSGQGGDSGRSF